MSSLSRTDASRAVCFPQFIVVFVISLFVGCAAKPVSLSAPNPRLVSALSGPTIGRTESIRIEFVSDFDTSKPIPQDAMKIEPFVDGTLSWQDEHTLVFAPRRILPGGTRYTVQVFPSKLSSKIAEARASREGEAFQFQFETDLPAYQVALNPISIASDGLVYVSGTVLTDKGENNRKIEQSLGYSGLDGIRWEHREGEHREGEHRFAFKGLKRSDKMSQVRLSWNGKIIGAPVQGSKTISLSSANQFEVLDIRPIPDSKTGLDVVFSQPIKKGQDLRSYVQLVSAGAETKVRYAVEGNIARVYGTEALTPGTELRIRDLTDENGRPLAKPVAYTVSDSWDLPEYRFVGKGTILPTDQGSTVVIETKNLAGLIVEAYKVHSSNMIQFLQVNQMDGDRELYRVGEPVWTKNVDLTWNSSDKNKWIRHGLDVSELAKAYPGELFRLRITFRKQHIRYECSAGHEDFSSLKFPTDELPALDKNTDGESSYWDYWEGDWEERQNYYNYRKDPCHPAFYMPFYDHNITAGRNVLVSNVGLLAKKSVDSSWLVVATDLRTTKPLANTVVRLINYQNRELTKGTTGPDGMLMLKSLQDPAFLIAEGAAGRGYLKLDPGNALAVSHFDISGDSPAAGFKGFIYGERGVWRPGDTIYLTFLLHDPNAVLPPNHPVVFELEDPLGRIVSTQTYTASVNGFYPMQTSTAEDAPTGTWISRVKVGGSTFTKPLKIEMVMPNRLKMTLNTGKETILDTQPTTYKLSAAWLHGAPAPNLDADVSVVFADTGKNFSTYTDYIFRDPSRTVSSERQMLFKGKLDANAQAEFAVNLSPGEAVPGLLQAQFMTRVFEPTGVFSSEQVAADFSPYSRYVGIKLPKGDAARGMLLTDTEHPVDIVLLDKDGNLVKEKVTLTCSIYKLKWRWWWEKGSDEPASFQEALSRIPLTKANVTISDGRGSWKFMVKYPEWGRYLVTVQDPKGGHAAAKVVYIDWPGWAGRAQADGQGAAAMLTLSTDKTQYRVGDTIKVSFPSNEKASAIVALEKGGKIIKQEQISCVKGTTTYELRAESSMAPNVYVHVSMLQEHLQTINDLPIRLYGVLPVMVEDPATILKPLITSDDTWKPMSTASFTVKEASGRPMTYTAVVVDEGLLGLTRYTMPDPRSTFYKKEASLVKSWDLYDDVIGAYAGSLQTLLAIGGGDDGFGGSNRKVQRFKPVVRYFGPVTLKAGESRTETFEIPQYVGALRIMVVAGIKGAYGVAERSVPVKGDLMVLGTLPRFLSPQDEITVPVSVFNYTSGKVPVTVRCKVSGNGSLKGAADQQLTLEASSDNVVYFQLVAGNSVGPLSCTITAEAAGLPLATHQVDLMVRSTAVPVTQTWTKMLKGGESWKEQVQLPGVSGTNQVSLELSRIPPISLDNRLAFLIQYPHGCIEQSTSAVFPQLYLEQVMQLDSQKRSDVRSNVIAGIERLQSFQTPDGGFSYWPGQGEVNPWGTNYAGHFLVEARRSGYQVPDYLIDKWVEYQKKKAIAWSASGYDQQLEQAYRLYTLALAGKPDLGSMNRLKETYKLDDPVAWRLAAAYWYAGQRDIARNMMRNLGFNVQKYRDLSGNFGSSFRDKAMMLESLVITEDYGRASSLLSEIAEILSSKNWLSTQETAYALIAVLPLMGKTSDSETMSVECSFQGVSRSRSFKTPLETLVLSMNAADSGALEVKNTSKQNMYVRLVARGIPAEGLEPAIRQGLALSVSYYTLEGKPIDPSLLPLGSDMEIAVSLKNTTSRDLKELALVHPLPAAWELMNYRLAKVYDADSEPTVNPIKYQDIRDDRILSYLDLLAGEEKVVRFRVNRTYGGLYFIPAIHAYAMYDESIRAVEPGRRIADQAPGQLEKTNQAPKGKKNLIQ
ncbi:alpha-2-macroglobulin [Gracilinema caldarium]|uniref:alpha-2-macroglobulin family protein n=1 Tax=Gracilinema caldarium TaxID=215591 RepID=UPI0026EB8A78|nr:MG2 domain-containing protein [Gracilinema caldarium]